MGMDDNNFGSLDSAGADAGSGLWKLYQLFRHSPLVRYHESLQLPVHFHLKGEALSSYITSGACDSEYPHLCPMEVLEVRKELEPHQTLLIANPPGLARTWITWESDDRQSLMKTIADLHLPNSWPQNAGHKVFYLFRERLRAEAVQEGPASLTVSLVNGKERHFRVIVSALLDLYRVR
jgi:hypothetical protein